MKNGPGWPSGWPSIRPLKIDPFGIRMNGLKSDGFLTLVGIGNRGLTGNMKPESTTTMPQRTYQTQNQPNYSGYNSYDNSNYDYGNRGVQQYNTYSYQNYRPVYNSNSVHSSSNIPTQNSRFGTNFGGVSNILNGLLSRYGVNN